MTVLATLARAARGLGLAAAVAAAAPAVMAQDATRPASFADLAERLSPAVVNISTQQQVGEAGPEMPQLPPGSPFEDMFRDFFERNQRGPRQVSSLGSGFVIDPSGYIVTNNHVIENADEIVANFSDGTQLEATLIGRDPKTDIAVLKVEPEKPLVNVDLGDSDAIRVGDWVLAIGNPFGLGGSVSAGIVSARNRDINAGPYDDFIQTDAAINRGNSGGPLFNMAGQVIGVNTAIISPSGGSIGIGFSVPSNLVKGVVEQLRQYGETRRGWLGVRIQTVTPDIAEGLGLDHTSGALVADVTAGGPAADAGIEAGDVILRFNGRDINEMRDLPRIVADTAVGAKVDVDLWRRGEKRTVAVELGRLEEGELVVAAQEGKPAQPALALGMTLSPLTQENRAELGIADDVTGVLVTAVDTDGPSAQKGVRPGDVIVEVAQQAVSAPQDVLSLIEKARQDDRATVLLLVRSAGELRFIALPLKEQ
jgi:serine protease Do